MFKVHQHIELSAVLTERISENLRHGDTGVVVNVHLDKAAYVVECLNLDGSKAVIGTVLPYQVRRVTSKDITHAHHVAIPARAPCTSPTS